LDAISDKQPVRERYWGTIIYPRPKGEARDEFEAREEAFLVYGAKTEVAERGVQLVEYKGTSWVIAKN
jgi:hypothetical protein